MGISEYAARIDDVAGEAQGREVRNPDGIGTRRTHQHGIFYEHEQRGALGFIPKGAVMQLWRRNEYEHGYLGYPTSAAQRTFDPDRVPFEGGEIQIPDRDDRVLGITYLNTQLIVDVGPIAQPYKGRGRRAQTDRVIEVVRDMADLIDVVCLAELFADDERARVRRALRSIYPHQMEGPEEAGIHQDGGLLLMSKHPFVETNKLIYRVSSGDDSWADKGILHARIRVEGRSGPGSEVDVYTSHLQASGGDATKEHQLRIIESYVAAISGRTTPAIVLADYNLDFNSGRNGRYRDLLGHPYDAWRYHDWYRNNPGITSDDENRYRRGMAPLPINSPERGVDGRRIDAAMVYPADDIALQVEAMAVDRYELEPGSGIDLSDHYGLRVKVKPTPANITINRRIRAARLRISRVHCLQTTSGAGEDEAYLHFWAGADGGALAGGHRVRLGDMDDGEMRVLSSRTPTQRVEGAGRQLDRVEVRVRFKEEDTWSRDDLIGDVRRSMSANQLLLSATPNRRHEFAMPLMTGDGSRYVVHMAYDIELV